MQKQIFFKGSTGGKTTTAQYCIDRFNATSGREEDVAGMPVSFTTRDIRAGEREGLDYYFLSKDEVEKLEREGGIIESTEIAGNKYGTLARELLRLSKCDILIHVTDEEGVEAALPFTDAIVDFSVPLEKMRNILRSNSVPESTINKRLSRTVNTDTLKIPIDCQVDELNEKTGELVYQAILRSLSNPTLERENEWFDYAFSPFLGKDAALAVSEEFLDCGSALKSYEFAKNLQGYGILSEPLRKAFEGHIIRRSNEDGLEGLVSFSLDIEGGKHFSNCLTY